MKQNSIVQFLTGLISVFLLVFGVLANAADGHQGHHEMQHGFILSDNDQLGSHLVATGHHSRQAEVVGVLTIPDDREAQVYASRKSLNSDGHAYFLLQAQNLNLPTLTAGQVLTGPIVESATGLYEPRNIIIQKAEFKIQKVLLNIENPFFKED